MKMKHPGSKEAVDVHPTRVSQMKEQGWEEIPEPKIALKLKKKVIKQEKEDK